MIRVLSFLLFMALVKLIASHRSAELSVILKSFYSKIISKIYY